ncbi:MAG: C39 family peptidase [Terriglobia bacterium]
MNKVENLTRPRVATPEEQLLSFKQAKQAGAEVMKLQMSQALVQILASNTSTPTGSSIGTSTSALTAGGTTTLPNVGNMPFFKQQGNACGTTTLAEIMSYLGVPMTQADVDKGIRRMNTFTAPDDMIEFARDHGLEAEGYNHGTWEEVKSMIDAGYPVQAMVNGDDSVSVNGGKATFSVDGLHYIAITGYETDAATGEEFVIYHDPNRTTEQRISVSDFEKMWGDVPGGFDNYFLAYGPEGADLPPGRDDGIESTLGVLNGVTNFTNGLDRIFSPDSVGGFLHGIAQVYGSVYQTVGCFVGGLFQLGAGWLNNAVEGIPVLENFVQPFGDLVNGFGAVVGDVFNGFGEACDSLGGAFESLFDGDFGGFVEGVGEAVGDFAGGVVDAVGDAVDAVGDAVSDFFSGW